MFGNWATGKLMIVIVPRTTMTIEITMATMGRLMKNLDMLLASLRRRAVWHVRLRVYLRAGTDLLDSFGHHALSWLQSIGNDPLGAHAVAHLDCPYADLVLAIHNRHLIRALQLRHGTLRHQQRVFLNSDGRPNSAVSPGTQNISRIGK